MVLLPTGANSYGITGHVLGFTKASQLTLLGEGNFSFTCVSQNSIHTLNITQHNLTLNMVWCDS